MCDHEVASRSSSHPLSDAREYSVVPQCGSAKDDYGQNSVRPGKVSRARAGKALSFGLVVGRRQCPEDCPSSLSGLMTPGRRDDGDRLNVITPHIRVGTSHGARTGSAL